MTAKKISRNNEYKLRGSLRKNGFDRWRLVMSGFSTTTGEERTFLIEFYIVNPSLSPKECVLSFKSRLAKTEADLQYALAGTSSAATASEEIIEQPSFCMVKAGYYGAGGKQVNAYFPSNNVEFGKREFLVRAGGTKDDSCVLACDMTRGSVCATYSQLNEKPELLCNAGSMDWNLKFDIEKEFLPDYGKKGLNWAPLGGYAVFSGVIHVDGEEFQVVPKSSFGYIDKNWGRDFTSPFFHLSSSNLTSNITGRHLDKSCFVVQGEYNERLSFYAVLDEREIIFPADKGKKVLVTYECTEMPKNDEDNVKLHWTVSIHDRNVVADIDIFCNAGDMFVRDYESPAGGRKVLKVLGGGTGTGEIRIYRRVKKNLELVEHATVSNAICEFGNFEFPEK